MKQYVLDVAGLSDRGVKRTHNEDAWSGPPSGIKSTQIATKGRLYVVADGVGGHLAGDVASTMAVEIIQQRYYTDPSPDIARSLTKAIQTASDQIDQEAAARPERRGMSTTVTAVVLHGDELTVANVGDSRTYLIRNGSARQITADHTWVEEQVRIGLITREEAAKHPQRNIITRSLGSDRELDIDLFEEQLEPGDSVLLCSDGLSNTVDDQEIGSAVGRGWKAKTVVKELIELSKKRGAPDNVTAVLITVVRRARSGFERLVITTGILGGLALVAGGLAFGALTMGGKSEEPIITESVLVPDASLEPSAPVNPTSTSAPLDTAIPPPELVRPAENIPIVAGEPITFVWNLKSALDEPDGRFIFELQADGDAQPFVREELPLIQRQLVISPVLESGKYLWTMYITGTETHGAVSGRFFSVVEPSRVPTEPPRPTPTSLN